MPLVPLVSYAEEKAGGTFVDKAGGSHTWTINEAHALIWDGKPFIPVGGMFCSKYLTNAQTDENWNADVEALKALKSKGILDIYVNPVKGATGRPTAAWQKLVDHLDSEGFRYGIELADGPTKPLMGWVIRPNIYRLAGIKEERTVDLTLPYTVGGVWSIADAKSGEIIKMGSLKPDNGKVSVEVRGTPESPRVLLIYPIKQVNAGADGLQNFWEGYSEYRDRVLATFGGVKFGPGMRFWVDPFMNEMGLRGETKHMIPASKSYQTEFESWLHKKYTDFAALARAWSLDKQVKTYEQASQLIPLWGDKKGLTSLYNTATGDTYKLSSNNSKMWEDIEEFRHSSIKQYLNDISTLLKRQIANVPVVVKWTANYPFLLNDKTNGFDGIGVEAYAKPSQLGKLAGAQCLAIAEQSRRPMWLLTTETQSTSAAEKQGIAYASKEELMASLNALKDSGSKGFYVFGFQLLPQPRWNNFEMLRAPEQLDWLKSFQERLDTEVLFADWKPRTVWFSAENPCGADITRLEQDLWWLPSQSKAEELSVEQGVSGYAINDADGTAIYIWTTRTPRMLDFQPPAGIRPLIYFTGVDVQPRQAKYEKNIVSIPLTKSPAIIRGIPPAGIMTSTTLLHQVEYLTTLVARAKAMKMMVGAHEMVLENAKQMIKSDRLGLAADTLQRSISELEIQVSPVFWTEGEQSSENSFEEAAYSDSTSGMRYLKLNTDMDPPMTPYAASFPVYAATEGDYEIWVAGTPPGQPWTSPVSWQMDESSWTPAGVVAPKGEAYAPDFYWSKISTAHLAPGKHILRLRVDGRRQEPDKNYVMSIDAIVISKEPFIPDGARRPEML